MRSDGGGYTLFTHYLVNLIEFESLCDSVTATLLTLIPGFSLSPTERLANNKGTFGDSSKLGLGKPAQHNVIIHKFKRKKNTFVCMLTLFHCYLVSSIGFFLVGTVI